MKICEGLASLNFQALCRQRLVYLTAASENSNLAAQDHSSCYEFYSNPLFAFPSNDQTMNLSSFAFKKKKKHLYEMNMKRVTAPAVSCDHTFKIQ